MNDTLALQARLGRWHLKSFGYMPRSPERMAKLREEVAEVIEADGTDNLGVELADVALVLIGIAATEGINLGAEIVAKLDTIEHWPLERIRRGRPGGR